MSHFIATCKPSKSFKLFFQYHYVNIPKSVIANWDPSDYNRIIQEYKLLVDPRVFSGVETGDKEILQSLLDKETIVQMTHPIHPNGCWFRALFPVSFIGAFKKLFISTLVFHYKNEKLPVTESVSFLFDTDTQTVTITDLVLYRPQHNPFFSYAQNAALLMSTEAIGLDDYKNDNKKVRDFYDSTKMISWRERSKLDAEMSVSDRPGVYMLYDKVKNLLYIGKGIRLIERIVQHTKNKNDPMNSFTHYRYSSISEECLEFLYLIENAAIHDVAWILHMPAAKKYKQSLIEKMQKQGISIENCILTNTAEHQTRKQ